MVVGLVPEENVIRLQEEEEGDCLNSQDILLVA